jgi:hypothetical protein
LLSSLLACSHRRTTGSEKEEEERQSKWRGRNELGKQTIPQERKRIQASSRESEELGGRKTRRIR